jgi:hypothetical protein
MSNALLKAEQDEVVNTVDFGPYTFILEEDNRALFKCERGFFWSKDQTPEIVTTGRKHEWGPNKTLVHHRDENKRLVPFREDTIDISWKKSISIATTGLMSDVLKSNKIVIDCRV